MTSDEFLFYFVDGLQTWTKQELQRMNVKDLEEAIAIAKPLAEFQRESPKPKEQYDESDDSNGEGDAGSRSSIPKRRRDVGESSNHATSENVKKSYVPKKGCYVCKGPHMMAKCPKLGSLSVMLLREEEEPKRLSTLKKVESSLDEVAYLGSIMMVEESPTTPSSPRVDKKG